MELPAPPTGGNSGVCNSYLPADSVFNRFMYVVQFLARNGIYVLLDNQINFDTTAVENTAGWLQVSLSPVMPGAVLAEQVHKDLQGGGTNSVNQTSTHIGTIPLQAWTRIAKAVNADSRVANRVIYDVLNEPDAFGLAFEPKSGKPGMRDLYLKSFDAIYAVNPGATAHQVERRLLRHVSWCAVPVVGACQ